MGSGTALQTALQTRGEWGLRAEQLEEREYSCGIRSVDRSLIRLPSLPPLPLLLPSSLLSAAPTAAGHRSRCSCRRRRLHRARRPCILSLPSNNEVRRRNDVRPHIVTKVLKFLVRPHPDPHHDAKHGRPGGPITHPHGERRLRRNLPRPHSIHYQEERHRGARGQNRGAATRKHIPVEELEMEETEVERRPREVVEDKLVLVRLRVVALDGGVAEDPVVGRRAGDSGGGGEGDGGVVFFPLQADW